ncbi:hypothetical protein MTQ13_06170 [Streptomyces sp. XM4011]|uniref:hypothetical protein n=1 Tax=Streptomyces TaxID=1883 RepID=UPI001FF84488|nr:hypothetical protein [Streptomyces sp. XM4011]MCK1813864.1 hypothetical protein [Streptomyces sp. XM4011]
MPRSRPGRVRAGLPRRPRPGERDRTIPGLSGAALAEIRRVERRDTRLWPGSAGWAWERWRDFVRHPARRQWDLYESGVCTEWACCGDPWEARERLDTVMAAMSRRGARELRRLIDTLDARY